MNATGRRDAVVTWLHVAGALGMFVFFGCLLAYDEVSKSPAWLVWPALIATLVGTFGALLLEWHRGARGTPTVLAAFGVTLAAFVAARLL